MSALFYVIENVKKRYQQLKRVSLTPSVDNVWMGEHREHCLYHLQPYGLESSFGRVTRPGCLSPRLTVCFGIISHCFINIVTPEFVRLQVLPLDASKRLTANSQIVDVVNHSDRVRGYLFHDLWSPFIRQIEPIEKL